MSYRYHFKNHRTGQSAIGLLQRSGGTGVSIAEIRAEVERVERGDERFRTRFPEPRPGAVKILPDGHDRLSYDDPGGSVIIDLRGLRVKTIKEED